MWNPDQVVHDECVAKILAVANEPERLQRFWAALTEIAVGSAMLPSNTEFRNWAGVIAQAALYPDDYKTDAL
jgi:hypothetical protein